MSTACELLTDAFDRVLETVREVLDGITPEQLTARVDDAANSVAWLVWHLTRVQDDHVADAAGTEQVWTAEGWCERFGLPFAPSDTGYGHSGREVGKVRDIPAELLLGYHEAVHDRTVRFVAPLTSAALHEVVDDSWTPPVTLAVRLVSVVCDDLQHAGQAAFVRGMLERRSH
ncbi:mycothiol transferase [Streptacidiphilus griseoplanus]|uniref:mycothiol transferase n=1 Tax=Peterkaempfera griseoplana TaxID=66896 RepID=UPI0006E26335|nr:DUF664 domain-containing protein [Peterkaempfera griseoplana]